MNSSGGVISLDCLFAVNFCLDFIALRLCSLILKKERSLQLAVCAALLSFIECLSCVFPAYLPFPVLAICLFSCVLLLFLDTPFALLYSCLSLWTGIFMTLMMKFFKGALPMSEAYSNFAKIDKKRLALAVSVLALLSFLKIYFDKKDKRPKKAVLEVMFGGKKASFNALRDSGNMLRDPLSCRCVAVLSKNAADKLGVSSQSIMKSGARVRVIPIKSVGHSGILYAFIPDSASVDGKKQSLCIALDEKNRDFSDFEAIIPSNT